MGEAILVAIWTDGLGNYQARCFGCPWRGPWRETGKRIDRQPKAVADANEHTEHIQEGDQ